MIIGDLHYLGSSIRDKFVGKTQKDKQRGEKRGREREGESEGEEGKKVREKGRQLNMSTRK